MPWIDKPGRSIIDAVQEPEPIIDALLEYLLKLQGEQLTLFGTTATAESADVRELERMFALEDQRSED